MEEYWTIKKLKLPNNIHKVLICFETTKYSYALKPMKKHKQKQQIRKRNQYSGQKASDTKYRKIDKKVKQKQLIQQNRKTGKKIQTYLKDMKTSMKKPQ